MLKGYKDFIMRGNVVDLAIAVILGSAFAKVVESFVAVLMNLMGKVFHQEDFSSFRPWDVPVGAFLTALVSFLMVSAVIYFFVVVPMNRIAIRRAGGVAPEAAPTAEALLAEIRDELRARRP
ncbi:large conductance mechanosensitive channel protein MscL [Arsenicicoccus dermatophilus]|uniref:large conductance mechanosensitive channel protein MscL n=1 Tax=Arsenicicoccus dermatophilus TaxID=1076331 RepID=UPI003917488E